MRHQLDILTLSALQDVAYLIPLSIYLFIYLHIIKCISATAIQKIVDVYGKPDVGTSGEEGMLQYRGGMFYDLGSGVGKAVIGR
jgi:hypothetical protein